MERTSARRRRHRADYPEEKKLMVTATICRLYENSPIIDSTVAEILAHQAHPHHKRRANPYCSPAGGIRHKGQLHDPNHLCGPHRKHIDGDAGLPGPAQEAAMSVPHGTGGARDAGFDFSCSLAMERHPRLGLQCQTEGVQ
jgi:hypothetical protein